MDPTQTTTEAKPAEQATPPAQPAVDVKKITEEVTSAVTSSMKQVVQDAAKAQAAENLKFIGRQISGENQPDPNQVALSIMQKEPLKFASTVIELAKTEIRKENAQAESRNAELRDVAEPILKEYPALQEPKKFALAERIQSHYISQGLTESEALKKGLEEAAKEFNLKSVSEQQKDGAVNGVALPTGGSFYPTGVTRPDEAKAQASFLEGIKAKAKSVRQKKS